MIIEAIDLTGKCSLESELIEILEYFNLTVRPIFHNPESLLLNSVTTHQKVIFNGTKMVGKCQN